MEPGAKMATGLFQFMASPSKEFCWSVAKR